MPIVRSKEGGRRAVENHDAANVLMRLGGGISAVLMANRAAWGRKGRIALQIFGSKGSIAYDQERMNEFELYQADGRGTEQGFRKILAAPVHQPYDRFIPAPGHGLGFNDLKIIECRELIRAISGDAVVDRDIRRRSQDREVGACHGTVLPRAPLGRDRLSSDRIGSRSLVQGQL